MREEAIQHLGGIRSAAVLALGAALLLGAGSALAGTKYFSDGAIQNSRGGWDLPKQGACPADLTATTRPECVARRFNIAQAACTAPTYSWSTGACTDLVNTTQSACENAKDRRWNANGSCAIVMADDDRNALMCVKHGGTWVTTGACTAAWVMPSRTDPAYGPGGLMVNDGTTGSAGAGDQCLRCHNNVTQYNGPRVRDTEVALTMGHKNMSRPVSPTFKPWGGPPFSCTGHPSYTNETDCVHGGGTWDPTIYPSDDGGNMIDWSTNKITVGSNSADLKWIYGDWLSPLPRAVYTSDKINNMSYSCGRCHTTGWTSDAGTTPNSAKHPESDFPGITWVGTGTTGQVKLAGGVAGDTNTMSSWDQWGIQCARCHYSAVDDSTSAPNFKAPSGMGTHNNGMTSFTNNGGVCTDVRWSSAPAGSTLEALCASTGGSFLTACSVNPTPGVCTVAAATKAKCTAVTGATWVPAAAGWCSNAFYSDSTSCTDNKYVWTDGWCKTADAQAACTGGTADGVKTWRLNGSMASCMVAGADWSFARCSVEGFCSVGTCSNSAYKNAVDCAAAGASWSAIKSKAICDNVGGTFAYATDVVTCDDAGGRWRSNHSNRGQIITSVCMDCHRQETSGKPDTNGSCSVTGKLTQGACIAAAGTWTETGNGIPLTVGPYHSTVAFPSHPHSNQFLNSPHAKFVGKFGEIATGKFDLTADQKYQSSFMTWGEASNSGNGCTGCHEVHSSVVAGAEPFSSSCADCHHVKSLARIQHPKGPGTPFEKVEEKPMEACVSCHMPGGLHLFRINTDPSYSTFPMPQAMAANTAASTAADGTFTNAVWVDIDAACGQCHGGGGSNVKTTGTIAAASASLTVASASRLVVGEKILVAGAGAYASPGVWADFSTYVKAIVGDVVTLAGTATHGVTNAAVTQNATANDAGYMTKATLASLAKGMHNDPDARFTMQQGATTLTVAVDASASKCAGDLANCDVLDWNWGDNSGHDTGVTATHAYAAPGTFTITLTVKQKSTGSSAIATQSFTAKAIPGSPTVTGSCTPNYPAWGVDCTVTVPTGGYKAVIINWGDAPASETTSNPAAGSLGLKHTYQQPGSYSIKATVVNAADLKAQATIGAMSSGLFIADLPTIKGKVLQNGGLKPVAYAQILITNKDGVVVKTAMSGSDGSYATPKLTPGTYTLTAVRSPYTFAKPFGPFTIGPSLTGQDLIAAP